MGAGQNIGPEPSSGISKHPCVTCQRRKVKCDRKDPCTRCLKSGEECLQPKAHRAPRKSRRTNDESVLDRVRQLESSLEQMRNLVANGKRVQDRSGSEEAHNSPEETGILEDSVGRLIIDDEKTRYIAGSSWANLADQVGDLRTLLEDDDGTVEDDVLSKRSFTHYLSNGMFPSPEIPWKASYSQQGLDFLWQTYKRHVDPVMKVFHVPSMQPIIENVLSGTIEISKGMQCLLPAIKFAAVISLTDDACWAAFNVSRKHMLDLYRSEVQATLDNANFLSTHSLLTLQAYALYQFCNRRHEHPRAMWIASGIAIRLAQSVGLHRDGALMKLPVLTVEIRRRLYWEIRMIDLGCAEDCGFLPTYIYGADTRLPLNINDADINSETVAAPVEREGFTDMTYALIRYEMCYLNRLQQQESKPSVGILQGDIEMVPEQTHAVAVCKSVIESKYLRFCSPTIPFQRLTLRTGQIILAKQSLVAQYPLFHSSFRSAPIPQDLKDELLETSCNILEWTDGLTKDPETSASTWMLQTYIHWHPLAFLLNELCVAPQHPQAARAWRAIEGTLLSSHGISPEANQELWRPLQGLLKRAKAVTQHLSPPMFVEAIATLPSLPGASFALPSTIAFDATGQPAVELRFVPDLSHAPPDDSLLAMDLQTQFATMMDFMTDSTGPQFDLNDPWWMDNDLEVPVGTGS